MEQKFKRCSKCKLWKNVDDFYNITQNKDGKDAYCKLCRHITTAEYTKKMTPEQLERRRDQKLEYYLRKSFIPYKERARQLSKHNQQST